MTLSNASSNGLLKAFSNGPLMHASNGLLKASSDGPLIHASNGLLKASSNGPFRMPIERLC